jgi:hypothetical protein
VGIGVPVRDESASLQVQKAALAAVTRQDVQVAARIDLAVPLATQHLVETQVIQQHALLEGHALLMDCAASNLQETQSTEEELQRVAETHAPFQTASELQAPIANGHNLAQANSDSVTAQDAAAILAQEIARQCAQQQYLYTGAAQTAQQLTSSYVYRIEQQRM